VSGDIISLYRARLAQEKGTVRKDRGGKVSVALVYPNYYRLGMSNLGFQLVYHLFNKRFDVVAERVFLPEGQEMSLYLQSGKPLLSLESQTPLRNFDLVAFSLSFENDYLNILKILELGKIPLLSKERPDHCPFVMAGGITTFLNPEPLAPFVDFFLLGEAEGNLNEFLDHFLECSPNSASRKEVVETLSRNINSLYVPSLYHARYHDDGTFKSLRPKESWIPEKIKVSRSMGEEVPTSAIITRNTELADRVLVELGRGCERSCRFCAAGYAYRPPRFRDKSDLQASIEKAMEMRNQVGLLAAAVSDVPGIEDLTSLIVEKGCGFSISSLRTDNLTRRFLDHLKQAGQKTLTIAPEAGSERLRKVINKHLTEDQIIGAAKLISGSEDFAIRLYFLVGLPTETWNDMTELADLVKKIKHHMVLESASRGSIGQLRLSINCFVPKPFTPFQWFPMEQLTSLRDKQKWLKKTLRKEGGLKVNFDVPRWAYVQALLSMGDRRVSAILLKAHELGGNWSKAFRISDVNPDFFVYRPKDLDETLPWDFIDHGIQKKHLAREYKLALEAEESDICRVGKCYRCGVCEKPEKDLPTV